MHFGKKLTKPRLMGMSGMCSRTMVVRLVNPSMDYIIITRQPLHDAGPKLLTMTGVVPTVPGPLDFTLEKHGPSRQRKGRFSARWTLIKTPRMTYIASDIVSTIARGKESVITRRVFLKSAACLLRKDAMLSPRVRAGGGVRTMRH